MDFVVNLPPLVTMALNAALAILLMWGCVLFERHKIAPPWKRNLAYGGLFGILSILTMAIPVSLAPGFQLDARLPLIAFASPVGGVWASPIAALLSAVYRLAIGGGGAFAGALGALASGVVGVLISRRDWIGGKWSFPGFLLLGVYTAVQIYVLLWFFSDQQIAGRIITGQWGGILVSTIVFNLAIGGAVMFARRQVEAERARSSVEAELRSIIENSPISILLKDAEGRFKFVGREFERRYAVSRDQVIGKTDFEFHTGEFADTNLQMDRQVFETGLPVTMELAAPFADGRDHNVVVTKFPVFDADGKVTSLASFSIDVTQQVETQRQLQQAQKMEAVGQLTGGIAHDFNNILMAALGNLEMLEARLADDARSRRLFESISMALQNGAALTNRLLAFSRRQFLEPVLANAGTVLAGMEELIRHTLDKNIEFSIDIDASLWPVMLDIAQLEAGVLNLALNARDAMPGGGRFEIRGENRRLARAEAESLGLAAGDYVALSFSDDGRGIPEEIQGRIFEPFFSTKPRGKGSGLGLSMVYGFAQQSGGGIVAESALEKGTTITLFLPRVVEAMRTIVSGTGMTGVDRRAGGRGVGRVLVVEDDPAVMEFVLDAVGSLGYTVSGARDAEEAMDSLANGGRPNLVLTDVLLGRGLNGIELAKQIGELAPGLPILLMSGYIDPDSRTPGLSDVDYPLLKKPFRTHELAQAIEDAICAPEAAGPEQ